VGHEDQLLQLRGRDLPRLIGCGHQTPQQVSQNGRHQLKKKSWLELETYPQIGKKAKVL
jgi:hypothetical protein